MTQMLKGVTIASTWYIGMTQVALRNQILWTCLNTHLWARRKAVILKGLRGEKKMSTRNSSDTPSVGDEQTSAAVRERW